MLSFGGFKCRREAFKKRDYQYYFSHGTYHIMLFQLDISLIFTYRLHFFLDLSISK